MQHSLRTLFVGAIALLCAATTSHAQVVETPAAFDSAGRVLTITPPLVARFELKSPEWPVDGDFRQARLFSVNTGGFVLAVERRTNAVDRFPLDDVAVAAIRAAVDAAMTRTGALVTEERTDLVSEPARGKFVRNQMFLAATLYAPLFASLTDDAQTGSAVYLLGTGASYFIVTSIANRSTVTRAQNDLATDGAFRGASFALGALATIGPDDPDGKTVSAVALAGALGGSVVGYRRARGLTDAEAKGAKSVSSYAALTTMSILGIAGVLDSNRSRVAAGAGVAAGVLGYALGPRYPRRSAYTVTAGDINMLWIGSTLGVATAFIPLVSSSDINETTGWLAFGGGLLGGALLAEHRWVRPYDHTQGEVAQIWLGTLGGALMGGAVVALAKPNATGGLALVTGGGFAGTLAARHLAQPTRARPRTARSARGTGAPDSTELALTPTAGRAGRVQLEWSSANLALAAAGVRGRHVLGTIRF